MLSSHEQAESPKDSAQLFARTLAAIKAPLDQPYENHNIVLNADLTDEQFRESIINMQQTATEIRNRINFADYTQFSLGELKKSLDEDIQNHDYSIEPDDEEEKSAEKNALTIASFQRDFDRHLSQKIKYHEYYNLYLSEEAKASNNFEEIIADEFKKFHLEWRLQIKHFYPNDGFVKFLSHIIGNQHTSAVFAFGDDVILTEAAIDTIFFECRYLPENSIRLMFSKNQTITDNQARRLAAVLPSIDLIEFTEQEGIFSDETAKALAYADHHDKLRNWGGRGALSSLKEHIRLIKSHDLKRIFHYGTECSTEDIEELIRGLKEDSHPHAIEIYTGDFSNPTWAKFFESAIGENALKIYTLSVKSLGNPLSMSKEVISAILTGLKTNEHIWKLELGILLDPDVLLLLAGAIAENTKIQELNLSNQQFTAPTLSVLFTAMTANPNSKIHNLILNYNRLGEIAAREIGALLTLNQRLTELRLGHTYIGKETCNAIGKALKTNTTLKKLSVFENEFGDEALMGLLDGALYNTTLTDLHTFQNRNFSQQCIDSYLLFKQFNYNVDFSIGLNTKENKAKSQILSTRNNAIESYVRLRYFNEYIWMAILLYRDHFHGKPTDKFIKLGKPIVDTILTYFFPKDKAPDTLNTLIATNMFTKTWNTIVDVEQPTIFLQKQIVKKKVLERWTQPGFVLKSRKIIDDISRNRISTANFNGDYIDLQKTELLAKALENNTSLTALDLSMCHIDDDEFSLIYFALKARNRQLTVLNLDSNHLTRASIPLLMTLVARQIVKNIMLYNNTKSLTNSEKIPELTSMAAEQSVKIHFEAPIKMNLSGFFALNRSRQIAADSKEEKSVTLRKA